MGTPQTRCRDRHQSGRASIMPRMRFSPHAGIHWVLPISASASARSDVGSVGVAQAREPLLGGAEDDRRLAAPAVRVLVAHRLRPACSADSRCRRAAARSWGWPRTRPARRSRRRRRSACPPRRPARRSAGRPGARRRSRRRRVRARCAPGRCRPRASRGARSRAGTRRRWRAGDPQRVAVARAEQLSDAGARDADPAIRPGSSSPQAARKPSASPSATTRSSSAPSASSPAARRS